MQEQLKKAILVVSFGTTYEETRKVTIDAIEAHLAEAFPDRVLYRGWTSRMIVRKLREQGTSFDTLEEAVSRMRDDGVQDVLVQPTHIISGAENDRMLQVLQEHEGEFRRITVGRPLLDTPEDRRELAEILTETILPQAEAGDPDRLILMGHGSAKKPEVNRIYPLMQQAFRENGREDVLVGTVEGTPQFADVLEQLGQPQDSAQRIFLAPMMIVAGDHARNDMAGEDPDSWKSMLEAKGFKVIPRLQGLGEYPGVREMICRHAKEAEPMKE